MTRKTPLAFIGSWLALALAPGTITSAAEPTSATAATGVLTGTISNSATGNLLEGARVEIPILGLAALTDNTGRFLLTGVPAGTHEVLVSYIGLDSVRRETGVAAGQRMTQDFDLTTGL